MFTTVPTPVPKLSENKTTKQNKSVTLQIVINGNSALHIAVLYGRTETVKMLIDAGIDVNILQKDGETALQSAANGNRTEISRFLIDNGIGINVQNKNGKTALHLAVLYCITEIVEMLIDAGIDVNLLEKDGNNALHLAARQDGKAIVTLLLDRYCDPFRRNNDVSSSTRGKKPYDLANTLEIKQLLKDYESHLPGLPIEVKKLDKKSAQVFSNLLGEENYLHFESRIMLAGEQGTGKTTIARHLVGKRPTRFRRSTDGIELYNGLSFFDRETKEWLGGQQGYIIFRALFNVFVLGSITFPDLI
ncbi:ankycorbin-like [Mytilus trossulus]|uniref:ankycorbin-like n=1 Tax=Mytilus trossulus TaxID=6551 RepID=UPI0030047331